jgi:hypothetical protein
MSPAPSPEHLTVVSWNVDGWRTIRDEQVALIDQTGAELLLAQEVTPASADVLREAGWEIVTVLELLPEDHVERAGRRPRFSCAVAVRGDLRIRSTAVLRDAPSPARTLVARIQGPSGSFVAMSVALPRSAPGRHVRNRRGRCTSSSDADLLA